MAEFTYPLKINGALVAELDVAVEYQGGPWGWSVEVYDLDTGNWKDAGRDWTDRVMEWAHKEKADWLDETRRDYGAGRLSHDRQIAADLNAAE